MIKSSKWSTLLFLEPLFLMMLLMVASGNAQSPAGATISVARGQFAFDGVSGLTMLPDGTLVVVWKDLPVLERPVGGPTRLLLRSYSPQDVAGRKVVVFSGDGGPIQVAGLDPGRLVVAFGEGVNNRRLTDVFVRRYGFSSGVPSLQANTTTSDDQIPQGIAVDESGNFVVVWESYSEEVNDSAHHASGIYGRRFDSTGSPLGPEFHVNTFRRGNQDLPSLAMSSKLGVFVVVWESQGQDGSGWGIYGQRFDANGNRLGSEFQVSTRTEGDQIQPVVAMDQAGNFVVAWISPDTVNTYSTAVFAQRFTAGGERLGGEIRVSDAMDGGFEDVPSIAADYQGNFVVSWNHWPIGIMMARLYRTNGSPVRSPVPLTRVPGWFYGKVAFAADGTFGAAWTDAVPADGLQDAYAQRFSASPGDEFCMFRRGEFVCDTGRTGGEPEIRVPFGGEPGEIGLLGDVDGDGRADPCVYREGVFRCDTEHDSGGAETRIRFGQAGDVPLLGDVDGDGRADPCVYRSGSFLCDTAHDGGAPEVAIAFGQPGDVPLLGDVDGDGKADPCVYRAGKFLCDTAHDGSVNVTIAFGGQPGDIPLLGDYDGDGRADPCIYRAGQLLCNTRHDGGTAQGTLTFGGGDGIPLLGNLDGL